MFVVTPEGKYCIFNDKKLCHLFDNDLGTTEGCNGWGGLISLGKFKSKREDRLRKKT